MNETEGDYTWGHNIGGTHKHEVLRVIDASKPIVSRYRYEVVLETPSDWQARAISVILNADSS